MTFGNFQKIKDTCLKSFDSLQHVAETQSSVSLLPNYTIYKLWDGSKLLNKWRYKQIFGSKRSSRVAVDRSCGSLSIVCNTVCQHAIRHYVAGLMITAVAVNRFPF